MNTYISRLTVSNFNNSKDTGEYQCTVGAGAAHVESTKFNISKVAGRL